MPGARALPTAAFYRVSTEPAGKKQVDMERAKTDLKEHQSICPFTVNVGHLSGGRLGVPQFL
jgi:hypothetical protein